MLGLHSPRPRALVARREVGAHCFPGSRAGWAGCLYAAAAAAQRLLSLSRQHPASLDAALSPAHLRPLPPQYIDAISSKQGELESYVSDGYRTALTEERRRLCFLVEKQCAVAKSSAAYHAKVRPRPRRDGCPAARSLRAFRLPRGAFWKEHDRVRLQTCLDSH